MSDINVTHVTQIVIPIPAQQVIVVQQETQTVEVNIRVGTIKLEPAVTQHIYLNPA